MRYGRKTAEQEAMASAVEQTRRLMEATFEGLFIHDAGVVLDANRAAASLFGRAVKELSRCRISELLAEESCRLLARQIQARNTRSCPITGVHKDGSNVPLEIKLKAVLTCNGRRLEVVAVYECGGSDPRWPKSSSWSRN